MVALLKKSLRLLESSRYPQAVGVVILMLVASALEGLGVGIVFPMAKIILEPTPQSQPEVIRVAMETVNASSPVELVLWTAAAFVLIIALKNIAMIGSVSLQAHFVRRTELAATCALLDAYFRKPYGFHLNHNSAILIRNVSEVIPAVLGSFMMPALRLVTEILVAIAITTALLAINPGVTLIAISSTVLVVGILYALLQGRFRRWGGERLHFLGERLKCLQQSLGGIKEVMVFGRADFFVASYHRIQQSLGRVLVRMTAAGEMRRAAVELVALIGLLGSMVFIVAQGQRGTDVVAFLGVIAAAALRLMPSANRILVALESMRGAVPFLMTAVSDFPGFRNKEVQPHNPLPPLKEAIVCEQISFAYDGISKRHVLSDVSLTIRRGEAIGLVGPSGGGKSTLLDIILGLLQPTAGRLLIDGREVSANPRAWQDHIGYVPQVIFLLDDTLRRNIAFGIPDEEIDENKIHAAVELAQLSGFVATLPDALDSVVGERGVRLSGGQRQRIGIARALYSDPDVLIFDEATSALDNETEQEITKAIYTLRGRKTVIAVAHRLSTLKECSRLVYMDNGRIVAHGGFSDLYQNCPGFRRLVDSSHERQVINDDCLLTTANNAS